MVYLASINIRELISKKFLLFLAIIGFISQTFYISQIYFSFESTVDIIVQRPQQIELPGITLCFNMYSENISLLNLYDRRRGDDRFHKGMKREDIEYELSLISIDNLHLMDIPENNIKFDCSLWCTFDPRFTENSTCLDIPCRTHSSAITTIIMDMKGRIKKCYTFFHRKKTDPPYLEKTRADRDLFHFKLYSNTPTKFYFLIHQANEIPYIEEMDFYFVNTGSIRRSNINFNIVKNFLLPYPYESDCKNYDGYEFGTRLGCIYKCRKKEFFKRCRSWPLNVPGRSTDSAPFRIKNSKCQYDRGLVVLINGICEKKCRQRDCKSTVYSSWAKMHEYRPFFEKQDNLTTNIHIQRPFGYNIDHISRPSVKFVEYICYIGSALGTWFGVSVIVFMERLISVFNKCSSQDKNINQKLFIQKLPPHFSKRNDKLHSLNNYRFKYVTRY